MSLLLNARMLQARPIPPLAVAAVAFVFALQCVAAVPSHAGTNRILGDSLSIPVEEAIVPWPDLVFGDDRVTQALGGAAPSAYLAGCDPDCFWLPADPDPDDVWWILLGTNERAHDPDATAESYHQNMLGVISRIPSHDIRLLSSPYTWDYLWLDRSEERAFLDEQAMVDQLICQELAHVTCVADLRPLLRAELHYLGDRVHFNQAGHAAIAEYLLVPEPGSLILCAWGVLMLARMPRRRR